MTIACCDSTRLPKPMQPNRIRLRSQVWEDISIQHPALISPVDVPTDYITGFPGRIPPSSTDAVYRAPGSGELFLPFPGEWKIFYNGSAAIEAVLKDVYSAPAVEFYAKSCYAIATHTAPSMGTTRANALSANALRKYALFVNDSANTIWISLGTNAAANTGIRLNASGGTYEMSDRLGNLFCGRVDGIASAASSVLLVTEGT